LRYEVTHGREAFDVEVREISSDLYEIRIGEDAPVRVDACQTARTVYSLIIGAKQYEGGVDVLEDGTLDVHVGSSALEFGIVDQRMKLLTGAAGQAAEGKQELRAEMPGKIVKVLVNDGDTVEADQGLLVIEAMKMENELRSPIAGRITAVEVSEGDAVESGALLVIVEPLED
jgi:biotin carboxyl carrier protein